MITSINIREYNKATYTLSEILPKQDIGPSGVQISNQE